MIDIGGRIKSKRLERGWTQEELANRMGYKNKSTINKIEKGVNDVTQSNIMKFSNVLGVSVAYLMGWEDDKKAPDNTIIGSVLKSLRTKRNLTLLELAEEMNITVEDVESYENGIKKVPVELLGMFAKYYDVSLDELMGIDLESSRKHIVITDNPVLNERYKKWQSIVGYNHFTDEEVDKLIDYAKYLISQRKDNET